YYLRLINKMLHCLSDVQVLQDRSDFGICVIQVLPPDPECDPRCKIITLMNQSTLQAQGRYGKISIAELTGQKSGGFCRIAREAQEFETRDSGSVWPCVLCVLHHYGITRRGVMTPQMERPIHYVPERVAIPTGPRLTGVIKELKDS